MRILPFFLLCIIFIFSPFTIHAQNAEEEKVSLTLPNNPVTDVLSYYEKLTGMVLVRDANLAGPNLSISAPQLMPKSQAIRLIEAALLLNGYAIVPDGDQRVKVINVNGKNPRSEAPPLYANPTTLPQGNAVVSYFMQLRFLAATDAQNIFTSHVVLHPYGIITPVPNAQALVITENANVIRELVNLQELVDVPPARVISEFVSLQRADAERVAEIINKLIETKKNERQGGAPQPAPGQPYPGGGPGSPPGQALRSNESFENDLVAGSVQLVPDARTNRILVVSRPVNFPYIKGLIEEFDKAVGLSAPLVRPLKYVSAAEVLPVLADLLSENPKEGEQKGGNQQPKNQPNQQNTAAYNPGESGLNSSSSGAAAHPDVLQETQDTGPTSMIVGKTRLIADNKANSILVIGPPESQEKVRTILDNLDRRPEQVYLATVIGQYKLTNDKEYGVDYVKLFQNGISTTTTNADGTTTTVALPANHTNGIASSIINTGNALLTPQNLTTAAAFPPISGLSIYGTIGKELSVYVHALESSNRFKVLARPVIYTANNKKAVISSGQRIAVPVSTISSLNTTTTGVVNNSTGLQSNIEYRDVVLKLEVIPLINANNEVNLKIAQVDDSVSGNQTISGNTVPTISTQQINTTVTVPNGAIVALGGLITETHTKDMSGIPILMHLPWVGPLFRDTKDNKERDELIILIQPTVVKSGRDILEVSNQEIDRAKAGDSAYQFAEPPLPDPTPSPTPAKKTRPANPAAPRHK